jgi:hypothetical protein
MVFGQAKSEIQTHREACLLGILPRKDWEKKHVSNKNQKEKVGKRKRAVKYVCYFFDRQNLKGNAGCQVCLIYLTFPNTARICKLKPAVKCALQNCILPSKAWKKNPIVNHAW